MQDLIFGATRGTGLEVARLLRKNGADVTALVRKESDAEELDAIGVSVVRGNALDPAAVEQAYAAGRFSAVVNTLGGKRGERPRPDVEGTRQIIAGAKNAGVSRVIMVTAIGAGSSRTAVAPKVLEVLGEVLDMKTQAEDDLQASGLRYTILRPGGMTNDDASGTAILTEDHNRMGVIHRADLAALVVDCLDDDATVGKILHTIDPEITWEAPLQRGADLPKSQ